MNSILEPSIVDESIDFVENHHLNLFLSYSNQILRALIFDEKKQVFLALEQYSSERLWDNIPEDALLFSGKFKEVKILVDSPSFTFIPVELFDQHQAEKYLNFNAQTSYAEKILVNDLKSCHAKLIFTQRFETLNIFQKKFPLAKYFHLASPLIESLSMLLKNTKGDHFFVGVHAKKLEIVIVSEGNFKYYNSFSYETPEDFIYYCLFVCEQVGLNPETIQVLLGGDIYKTSPEFEMLYKYFREITFIKRNDQFNYSYKFDKLVLHPYFSFFNLALCE